MEDVTGATVLQMQPSTKGDVMEQLNSASKTHRVWPWVLFASFVLANIPVIGIVLFLLGIAATFWAFQHDKTRRTVALFYDVADQQAERYQALVSAFEGMSNSKIWQVTSSGKVQSGYQRKVNAGATGLIKRSSVKCSEGGPPQIVSNISIPSIEVGRQGVYCLPDQLLIRDGKTYVQLDYSAVQLSCNETRFIEDERPPSDSTMVGQTWKYVNKSGGPDKRFKNNRQLPIMQYGQIDMEAGNGFRRLLQVSNPTNASKFVGALGAMNTPALQES